MHAERENFLLPRLPALAGALPRARRWNTERRASSGTVAAGAELSSAVHRGCCIVFNPCARGSPGARPNDGERRDGCTAPRTWCPEAAPLSVFNQPETHKEPSGSPSPSLSQEQQSFFFHQNRLTGHLLLLVTNAKLMKKRCDDTF